jgi:sugar lactone lactonase YvrE
MVAAHVRSRPAHPIAPVHDRGPATIEHDFDPSGLVYDGETQGLFIADGDGERILRWSDRDTFETYAELPKAVGPRRCLGQIARSGQGTLLVPRYGFGLEGAIYAVREGAAVPLPGLPPELKRLGLAINDDNQIFATYFRACDAKGTGAVTRIGTDGDEVDLIVGLDKPTSVLCGPGRIWIADQALGAILVAHAPYRARPRIFAELPAPDGLCLGPNGDLFATSKTGAVYRLDARGRAKQIARGLLRPRGVAFDPMHRRLFVADHDPDGERHALRIIPIS